MPVIHARELAAIDAAAWYDAEAVGRLFGRTARTARRWCRDGLLPSKADPFDPRRVLVPGAALQAKAGELLLEATPAESETERQREARARRELEEIERLVNPRKRTRS